MHACLCTLCIGDTRDIETGGEPQVLGAPFEDPDAVPMGMLQRSREHKQWWRVAGRQLLDVAVPEERRYTQRLLMQVVQSTSAVVCV